jgi:hypothetical protein
VRRILDNFYWSAFNQGFDAAIELTDSADICADRRFLQWIFDRLVNVHGENPNYEYMHKLKEIIDNTNAVSPTEESKL